MEGGSEVDAVLVRRAYVLRNAGLAIAAAGAAIALLFSGDSRILWLVVPLFTGGLLTLLGLEGTSRRIDARLDAEGVRVGDRLVARRSSLRAAWIERDGERTCVRVHGVRPALRLEARDVADARRLLRALRLDWSQTVMRFPSNPARVWPVAVSQGVLQLIFWGLPLLTELTSTGLTWRQVALMSLYVSWLCLVTFLLLRGETVLGADGVLFLHRLGRTFVPFSEIQSVQCDRAARLVVRTREGKTFRRAMPVGAAQAATEAIQSSCASIGGAPETLRQRLRRATNEEDAAAWVARVRTLAAPVSYRASGVAAEVLWQVFEDPGASASERAAAAVALETNATPYELRRLREVAARIASPRVRVAIGHIAARKSVRASEGSEAEGLGETALEPVDGEDEELIDAMASISDRPRRWRVGQHFRRR